MKSFFVVMVVVLTILLSVMVGKSMDNKIGLAGVDAPLVDKTPTDKMKVYDMCMYSGGVNVALYAIKSWRILGMANEIISCITVDDKEIIIKGDWIIIEE